MQGTPVLTDEEQARMPSQPNQNQNDDSNSEATASVLYSNAAKQYRTSPGSDATNPTPTGGLPH